MAIHSIHGGSPQTQVHEAPKSSEPKTSSSHQAGFTPVPDYLLQATSGPLAATTSDIPEPDMSHPVERAHWVTNKIDETNQAITQNETDIEANQTAIENLTTEIAKYDDLLALKDSLQSLSDAGDQRAKQLLDKLKEAQTQRDSLQSQLEALKTHGKELDDAGKKLETQHSDLESQSSDLEKYAPNGDFDGDGIINSEDPDIDGDGLTNDYERQIGTNPYDVDTDHDGLTDRGEMELKQIAGYEWMDPNNADSDGNGRIDGIDLPDTIAAGRRVAQPGATSVPGTPGTPGAAQTNSTPALWRALPSDPNSTAVNRPTVGTTVPDNGKDTEVTVTGDTIEFSKSGRNLIVNGTTIENFFDASGKPARRIYLKPTDSQHPPTKVKFNNMDANDIKTIKNADGYASAGVHFPTASGTLERFQTTSSYDPFSGSMPIVPNPDPASSEMIYDVSGLNSQIDFPIPESIDGKEVKQVAVTKDGNDAVVTLKDKSNQTLKVFRLQNGASKLYDGSHYLIQFKLANNGQLFAAKDLAVKVVGGDGDDVIKVGGGSYAEGGKGNDVLKVFEDTSSPTQGVTFYGGEGDDILMGGDARDDLYGGDGMDILYSGGSANGGSDEDIMHGDAGADFIVGSKAGGNYHIDGGGGSDPDASNIAGPNVQGVELGQIRGQSVLNTLIHMRNDLASNPTNGTAGHLSLDKLDEAIALATGAQATGADSVYDVVSSFLTDETSSREGAYINGGSNSLLDDLQRRLAEAQRNNQPPQNTQPPANGTPTVHS